VPSDDAQFGDGLQQSQLPVGDTRKPAAVKDQKRVTTGDLAALAMCAHRFEPGDVSDLRWAEVAYCGRNPLPGVRPSDHARLLKIPFHRKREERILMYLRVDRVTRSTNQS